MNCRIEIRALIPDEASKMNPAAIIAALPQYDPQLIRTAIGQMSRGDNPALGRSGNRSDGFSYWSCRAVKTKAFATPEERAAGKKLTDAAHNRRRVRNRAITSEQQRAAKALAKQEARNLAAIKRAAEKAATRKATEEKRIARAKKLADERARANAVKRRQQMRTPAQRMLSNAPARPHLPHVTEAAKPVRRVETTAEWMLRTGKRPEVLPIGAVSQPLKFAGQRDIAKVTWRQREAKAA